MSEFLNAQPITRRLTIAILLAATVPIFILVFYLNNGNQTEIESLQTTNQRNSTQELARNLEVFVEDEINRVGNLATSRSAQQFVSVNSADRSELFTPTLEDFTNFLASDEFYESVVLLDTAGDVLLATEGNYIGANFSQFPFFQFGKPMMSDPALFALDQKPLIWLSAPVESDGRSTGVDGVLGVVAVAVSAEKLWQRIEAFHIGRFGYAILIDDQGKRLAHGQNRTLLFRSLAETNNSSLWQTLSKNENSLFTAPSPSNDGLVYHQPISLTNRNWTVVSLLHENEVLFPAQKLTTRGIFATILLVALLAFTVYYIAQQLLKAIPQLADATAQFAATGDLSEPIDIRARGEIGVLAMQFEQMRQSLYESNLVQAQLAKSLTQKVGERTQELAALSEVITTASRTLSRDDLLSTALSQALGIMDAQLGGIWLIDGEKLTLTVSQGFTPKMVQRVGELQFNEGWAGRAAALEEVIVIDDLTLEPESIQELVQEEGLRAFVAYPLLIRGHNHGVLGVIRRINRPFSNELISFAHSIAQQIALTLDNLDLVNQVRFQTRTLASVEERERIAADIHDSMAQTVGYLYLQWDYISDSVDRLDKAQIQTQINQQLEVLNRLSSDIRQYILHLREPHAQVKTVSEMLTEEVASLHPELDMLISLSIEENAKAYQLTTDESTELSRIVGEALRNAYQHGQATQTTIHCALREGGAQIDIVDNGVGFDVNRPFSSDREHFGLEIMQARAQRINGTLTITSTKNKGTDISITWPTTLQSSIAIPPIRTLS